MLVLEGLVGLHRTLRSPGKISRLGGYPCTRWEFGQKIVGEKKRLNNLVYWDINKIPRQGICTIYVGPLVPLEYRKVPLLGLLLAWNLKAGASK